MKKLWILILGVVLMCMACGENSLDQEEALGEKETIILKPVPEGAQALSLFDEPLFSSIPGESTLGKYEAAKAEYEAQPNDADKLIWFGRWTAYKGDYRESIRIYSDGIRKFPEDARIYRHRGHRYISIREFDRAIQDFEKAVSLIEGTKDQIEPDGQPNAQNIPISSLHTKRIEASQNDDNVVSTVHWLYMTLCLLGRNEEAEQALELIHKDMNIIENMAYHELCLFYKVELSEEDIIEKNLSDSANAAVEYGIANYYFYSGDKARAQDIYERMLKSKGWASFGYIAAEADFVREFRQDI